MHHPPDRRRRGFIGQLIAVGAALGSGAASAASVAPAARDERAAYHVGELARAPDALRYAANHLDARPHAKLVIVALGSGVDFLLEGTPAPHGNSYAAMVDTLQFRGVRFRVCNNTLKARSIDRSRLLPEVAVVESGIAELVTLQVRDGYAYIKT